MIDFSTLRSVMFVPATKLEKLEEVHKLAKADLYIIDLEDSILPAKKNDMRLQISAYLRNQKGMSAAQKRKIPPIALRINQISSINGVMDLMMLISSDALPEALILPKIESVEELNLLEGWLMDAAIEIPIIPLIETLGVWEDLDQIIAHDLVPMAMLGGIDLAAMLGCEPDWEPMFPYRSALLLSCRKFGKACIDMPWFDLKNLEGLRRETERVRALGFDGKAAIHPAQVEVINDCLTPTAAQIKEAREIIKAFTQANDGVAVYNGKVLEIPVIIRAERILKLVRQSEPVTPVKFRRK
jgi:citrate lyase beta subunit